MLTDIKIDLASLKSNKLNESFVAQWGADVKYVLKHVLSKGVIPSIAALVEEEENEEPKIVIRGSKNDLNLFSDVMMRERDYALKYLEMGLGNPEVSDAKMELEKSIYEFEKGTGLIWPLR
jgi:hypothetical protein